MSCSRLPSRSRTFSAPTSMVNSAGSARRDVRMSTSMAVHAPIAASSSSTGVNSPSDPVPTEIVPPVSFVTVYLPGPVRAILTCRCPSCAISVAASPCRAAAVRPAGHNAGHTAAMPGHGGRLNEGWRAGVTARAPGTRWWSWTRAPAEIGFTGTAAAIGNAAWPAIGRPVRDRPVTPPKPLQRGTTQRARGTARRGRERGMSLHDLFTQAGRHRARRRFRLRLARRGLGLPGLPGAAARRASQAAQRGRPREAANGGWPRSTARWPRRRRGWRRCSPCSTSSPPRSPSAPSGCHPVPGPGLGWRRSPSSPPWPRSWRCPSC